MFQCTRLKGIIERDSKEMDMTNHYTTKEAKTETIFSVIKKMFGENVTSQKISTQNRELFYRIIAYNSYQITRNKSLIWYGFYTADF